MSDENKDVNLDGGAPSDTPPAGDPSTPPSKNAEDKTVPYHRFKEINDKVHNLEEQLKSYDKAKNETGKINDQETQAREYLQKLLEETLDKKEKMRIEMESKEQAQFESEVKEILEINSDVKESDFLKFLEEKADDYGVQNIAGAMKLYRDLNNLEKESVKKAKADLTGKPKLPSNEGPGGSSGAPESDKGKTIYQIAQEAAKAAGLR